MGGQSLNRRDCLSWFLISEGLKTCPDYRVGPSMRRIFGDAVLDISSHLLNQAQLRGGDPRPVQEATLDTRMGYLKRIKRQMSV